MGDMADWDIENGENQWFDHLSGHKNLPADNCPYCEQEEELKTPKDMK